jgi:hypothetical protein
MCFSKDWSAFFCAKSYACLFIDANAIIIIVYASLLRDEVAASVVALNFTKIFGYVS